MNSFVSPRSWWCGGCAIDAVILDAEGDALCSSKPDQFGPVDIATLSCKREQISHTAWSGKRFLLA